MSDSIALPLTSPVILAVEHRQELVAFLRELIVQVGPSALQHFRKPIPIDNKQHQRGGYDPVTQADLDVEAQIRALISQRYPTHGIYGEEHGFEKGSSGLTWVIDPIDGTRAFITGQVNWGILIGLYDGQKPVLGAMYQPFTRELFISDGESSWLEHDAQSTRLAVRACPSLEQSVLCCTTPQMFTSTAEREAFKRLSKQVQLYRFGGDCYSYCLLAHGLIDLIVEADLQAYDVQALIPIVVAAGGVITNWQGESAAQGGQIVAAGDQRMHAAALRVLANDRPHPING